MCKAVTECMADVCRAQLIYWLKACQGSQTVTHQDVSQVQVSHKSKHNKPSTNTVTDINTHKFNQNVVYFSVQSLVYNCNKAGTCWYRCLFSLIYQYQFTKTCLKKCRAQNQTDCVENELTMWDRIFCVLGTPTAGNDLNDSAQVAISICKSWDLRMGRYTATKHTHTHTQNKFFEHINKWATAK